MAVVNELKLLFVKSHRARSSRFLAPTGGTLIFISITRSSFSISISFFSSLGETHTPLSRARTAAERRDDGVDNTFCILDISPAELARYAPGLGHITPPPRRPVLPRPLKLTCAVALGARALTSCRELTLIEFDIFGKVTPRELLSYCWKAQAENIKAIIARFNEVSKFLVLLMIMIP
jgi:hypothetical protein